MFSHECGEDFDDRPVFALRRLRDPLKRIDPAKAHVQALVAELLDRTCEPLRDLALTIQLERARGEVETGEESPANKGLKQRRADIVLRLETLRGGQLVIRPDEQSRQDIEDEQRDNEPQNDQPADEGASCNVAPCSPKHTADRCASMRLLTRFPSHSQSLEPRSPQRKRQHSRDVRGLCGRARRPRRPSCPDPSSVLVTMIVFQGPRVPRGAPTKGERQ